MLKQELLQGLIDVIINNSNLEADDDDNIVFENVEMIESNNYSIHIVFTDGQSFTLTIEKNL